MFTRTSAHISLRKLHLRTKKRKLRLHLCCGHQDLPIPPFPTPPHLTLLMPAGSITLQASLIRCCHLSHRVYVQVDVNTSMSRSKIAAGSSTLRHNVGASVPYTVFSATTTIPAAPSSVMAQMMACFITVMIPVFLCGCCSSMLTNCAMMGGPCQRMFMTCSLHISS